MNIIGFDFSINKPAACLFKDNEYSFWFWPHKISKETKEIFEKAGVNIILRNDEKYKEKNSSEKMRFEVQNAIYLSDIISTMMFNEEWRDTYVSFEGLSYGSAGDAGIQLGGYKYILMFVLAEKSVLFERMFTYAPITIKKTANCSKKGMGKQDMIKAFINTGPDCKFKNFLKENEQLFIKKRGKNYIEGLDDLIDSYYALKTLEIKENLTNI